MASSFETMNMIEVSVEQFTQVIREEFAFGNLTPIIGIGKSGIGKTESIFQLTQEMKIGFCELRLVTMTETDILGIPKTKKDEETGEEYTTWVPNKLLPTVAKDGPKGILVLDELTSAQSTVRAAAYQLMDSKRALAEYKLPDGWMVVGLGNGPDDGGVFQGMEYASLSRARCFRVEPRFDVWCRWAQKDGVNSVVIAFLQMQPGLLHDMDPDAGAAVFPCPRSWVALSKMLNAREANAANGILEAADVSLYASCCVGESVAATFDAFYNYKKQVINVEDVLSGKSTMDSLKRASNEVWGILQQNLYKVTKQKLESNDLSEKEKETLCINLCNWLADVADINLNFLFDTFQLIGKISKFSDIIVMDEFEEKKCPKIGELYIRVSSITDKRARGNGESPSA
jgi:hypothetical protein